MWVGWLIGWKRAGWSESAGWMEARWMDWAMSDYRFGKGKG